MCQDSDQAARGVWWPSGYCCGSSRCGRVCKTLPPWQKVNQSNTPPQIDQCKSFIFALYTYTLLGIICILGTETFTYGLLPTGKCHIGKALVLLLEINKLQGIPPPWRRIVSIPTIGKKYKKTLWGIISWGSPLVCTFALLSKCPSLCRKLNALCSCSLLWITFSTTNPLIRPL